jgi:hypothetical protein
MNPFPAARRQPPQLRRRRGFALVITLSLMVLLTLLAVGLLTLSAVSLRAGGQGEAMATAKNNARLALVLAIGELQKTLGPDKAVTASSGLLAEVPAKPNLTGVWESWDFNPNSGTLDYESEKEQRFRRWLVSNPDFTAVAQKNFGATPWQGKNVELVGKGSLGESAKDEQRVTAGLVPVAEQGKVAGSYAWHVADEAAKARINLYRKPVEPTEALARKRAMLVGHRPDPAVMKSTSGTALAFLPKDLTDKDYEAAVATTGKVLDLNQVDLLGARDQIKQFRNDVTPYSLGLLTDVRRGGLKQDLSSLFEMSTTQANPVLPNEFNGKKLYQSTHGITGVSDPYWSTLAGYYNVFRSITNPDSNPTFYQRPAESLLVTNPAPPRKFYPGPVIAKIETLFTYVTRDSHANWVNTLHGVDPQMSFMGHLIYTPLVTLHNPYNINLSFDSLEVIIRNPPVAFNFYVNDRPQSSRLVPLTDMFVYGSDRTEKSFALRIANWSSPSASSPSGQIIMKPGQTLVCGPYLNPDAAFADTKGTPFFDWQNNLTGYKADASGSATINPIKAKPGFAGRCVGFDVDWITPTHNGLNSGQQTDNNQGVLGLRATDRIHMEYALEQPTVGLNTEFQVTAKLTANGATLDYGGLSFQYRDSATLKKLFKKTYRYPLTGSLTADQTYAPNTEAISKHARAKTVAVFSAYARTCNGGVYETNKRTETNGALNVQRDGQLAGMPFLFHNAARNVVSVNLQREKLGAHSHELNFQPLPGSVDDVFEVDSSFRTPSLTGNTTLRGIKSGSYLELPTGPLQTLADFRRSNALSSSYLPNLTQPVANSLISPLLTTGKVVQTDATIASYALLDHSVLANHALYDRFYFSTFATDGKVTPDTVFEGFLKSGKRLASQAYQAYLPPGRTVEEAKEELFAAGKPKATAYQTAAEYQLVRGPFNVNSTSVQAWKAVLATLNKSDIYTLWAKGGTLEVLKSEGTPIPAMSLINGGKIGAAPDAIKIDNAKTNEWNGYRELAEYEIEELAKQIVEQVRLRGPFLSLSEFVNRRIGAESELTRSGALELALAKAKINDQVFTTQIPLETTHFADANLYNYKTPLATVGNPAAGAPGWISQGDLLRILEPAATVRADTFVIRVCGEAQDANGKVTARAYAEAVVQRMPEYVDPIDRPSLNVYTESSAAPANRKFGRRMTVVSFRWLSGDEI